MAGMAGILADDIRGTQVVEMVDFGTEEDERAPRTVRKTYYSGYAKV